MILEESANENVRSVINNVKMTAMRRALTDPPSVHSHRKEISFGGLGLGFVQFYHSFTFIAFKCSHHPGI